MNDLDYIRQSAEFLLEAHPADEALEHAQLFSRTAFETGDLMRHTFWKSVFDLIETAMIEESAAQL